MKNIIVFFCLFLFVSCQNDQNQKQGKLVEEIVKKSSVKPESYIGNHFFIDDQHSYIGFKIKYFGFSPVRGRFNKFDGTAFYNENDISGFSASIFIDANSINTGNERRDNDLTSEGTWFNTPQFPTIIFKSVKVTRTMEGGFDLLGDVTIKGITKRLTFQFEKPTAFSKDWAGNDQVDFTGKTVINRQDFGVYGGDFWSSVMENGLTQLSDEVEIELEIHCRKANYQIRYEDADSTEVNKIVLDKIKNESFESGAVLMDQLYKAGKFSAGKFSSVGHTLNSWKMHEKAIEVFSKRLEYYPESLTSHTQLGITNLFLGNYDESAQQFKASLKMDSTYSKAWEYLRLLESLKQKK